MQRDPSWTRIWSLHVDLVSFFQADTSFANALVAPHVLKLVGLASQQIIE